LISRRVTPCRWFGDRGHSRGADGSAPPAPTSGSCGASTRQARAPCPAGGALLCVRLPVHGPRRITLSPGPVAGRARRSSPDRAW